MRDTNLNPMTFNILTDQGVSLTLWTDIVDKITPRVNLAFTSVDLIELTVTLNHRQATGVKWYYIPMVLPEAIQHIVKTGKYVEAINAANELVVELDTAYD